MGRLWGGLWGGYGEVMGGLCGGYGEVMGGKGVISGGSVCV